VPVAHDHCRKQTQSRAAGHADGMIVHVDVLIAGGDRYAAKDSVGFFY